MDRVIHHYPDDLWQSCFCVCVCVQACTDRRPDDLWQPIFACVCVCVCVCVCA